MKKYINSKSRIAAARDAKILSFAELTPEQQEKAVALVETNGKLSDLIYDWHSDDVMEIYHYEVQELAKKTTDEFGITINTDKLYWQSNSQGPYSEWDLSKVFDSLYEDTSDIEWELSFYGKGLDVTGYVDLYLPDEDGDYSWEYDIEVDNSRSDGGLSEYNVDAAVCERVVAIVDGAQSFIDGVWRLVEDVCTSYPDDEWIRDALEANEIEFLVDGDTVRYV